MKSRRLASLALVAAVLVGTSGCALISPQATLIPYAPADGVSARTGDVAVRNAIVVSEDGLDGNLVVALVNEGDDAQTVTIGYGEDSAIASETVRIPANTSISLGSDQPEATEAGLDTIYGVEPIFLADIDTIPGAMMPMYFQAGDSEGALVQVPVLTGEIDYLRPFVP